jgi:iron complex transport system substrate-binding protein
VVSLAPNITETICALEAGTRLVGVSDFDDYPPMIRGLPKLGGYIDPDLERLSLLRPALIFVPGEHQVVSTFAAQHGLSVVNVHMDSLETIDAGIATIGTALKVEKAAARLRRQITNKLNGIRDAVAPFERPKVLIVLARERGNLSNLQTVGGTSFISELVAVAGGDNIYGDVDKPYLEASKETVVVKAPDVILEIQAGNFMTRKQSDALHSDWRAMDTLPAWQKGRIYIFTDTHMMRPGPRIGDVAAQIARKLHFSAELPE